jgi:tripartite-type tricarboxylate transporter receptor subunit TctC
MPPDRTDGTGRKPPATIGRRQLMRGLAQGLVAAPAWAAAASTPARATGTLELGVMAAPGSARQAAARRWAARWARQLGQAVSVVDLPATTDVLDWCQPSTGAARAVLATVWQGAATATTTTTSTGACSNRIASPPWPGLQTLAALAREPLVLMADRFMPRVTAAAPQRDWAAVQQALKSSATPWRCGMDSTDAAARVAALRLLQALGLGRAEPVDFRGPAQLVPALAGARMPLAVLTAGLCIGSRWEAMAPDQAPGQADGPVAAHRRGDIQLWAVAERARLPGLPQVPTADELLGCTGNDIGRWQLLLAPAEGESRFMRRLAAAAAATPWSA